MGVNRIAAYAQNLGIILLEPAVSLPEQGSLAGSTGGKVKHMERQHHHLFAAILAQGNLTMLRRGQLEIWGNIANCCKHNHTPQNSGAPSDAAATIIPHNPNFRYPQTPHRPQVHPELVEGWTDWPRLAVLYYPPWRMKRH